MEVVRLDRRGRMSSLFTTLPALALEFECDSSLNSAVWWVDKPLFYKLFSGLGSGLSRTLNAYFPLSSCHFSDKLSLFWLYKV